MKVLLGAGSQRRDGWFTIDANPTSGCDLIADARDLRAVLGDGSCDELEAVDVLEHISYRHTGATLWEWRRVLKQGGRLFVQVPDADEIMRWYVNEDLRLLRTDGSVPRTHLAGAMWRLLGGHGDDRYASIDQWHLNAHNAMFSARSLATELECAGFGVTRIKSNAHPNLQAWAVRL